MEIIYRMYMMCIKPTRNCSWAGPEPGPGPRTALVGRAQARSGPGPRPN